MPEDVVKVYIKPISFNDRVVSVVFIDLDHINRGKNKKLERSALSLEDVLKFVFLLNELSLEPDMMRGSYLYFCKILKDENEKPFKIVFCQDSGQNWIGVITLHRVRDNYEN